jgi:hypothetical protein
MKISIKIIGLLICLLISLASGRLHSKGRTKLQCDKVNEKITEKMLISCHTENRCCKAICHNHGGCIFKEVTEKGECRCKFNKIGGVRVKNDFPVSTRDNSW